MVSQKDTDLITKTRLEDICQANDIVFWGLFGSYARGDFNPDSDVDFLVRFSRPKGLLALVRIERELSKRLGRPVDLVTEASVSLYLRERIEAELMTVYEKT